MDEGKGRMRKRRLVVPFDDYERSVVVNIGSRSNFPLETFLPGNGSFGKSTLWICPLTILSMHSHDRPYLHRLLIENFASNQLIYCIDAVFRFPWTKLLSYNFFWALSHG